MDWLLKKQKPSGFWNDIENQKKCITEHLMPLLNMTSFDGLYNLVLTDFHKNNCGRLATLYKHVPEMLITLFPEFEWLLWKFKQVPTGFWDDIQNQKKYIEWLRIQLNITRIEEWYNITNKDFVKNSGQGLLLKFYEGSIYKAISTILNEYEWYPWLFPKVYHNFWLSIDNQRMYLNWLYKMLEYKCMDDWYKITTRQLNENYGNTLTMYYPHSYNMCSKVYPEIDWLPWKFVKSPTGYWDNINNCKTYMEWLYKELKYQCIDDWYKITKNEFIKYYGQGLRQTYKSSTYNIIVSLVERTDELEWMPWKFAQTTHGWWKLVKNQKKYLDWLVQEFGFITYNDYYNLNYLHFHKNYGNTLLYMYESNIYNIIQKCYPDYEWDKNKFPKKNVSIGELEWMEYLLIQYPNLQYRNDQYRLPHNKRCSVDGFDLQTNTIFQYHGCYWHGCPNCFPNRLKTNRKKKTYQECYALTNKLKKECIELDYNYIELWECKWIKTINAINYIKKLWKFKNIK